MKSDRIVGQISSASPITTLSTCFNASSGSIDAWIPPMITGTPLFLYSLAIEYARGAKVVIAVKATKSVGVSKSRRCSFSSISATSQLVGVREASCKSPSGGSRKTNTLANPLFSQLGQIKVIFFLIFDICNIGAHIEIPRQMSVTSRAMLFCL